MHKIKLNVIFYAACFCFVNASITQVQYKNNTSPSPGKCSIGYINMRKSTGYKLDVTPYKSIHVEDERSCTMECIKSNGVCLSINLESDTEMMSYQCHLLDTDYFRVNDPSKYLKIADFSHLMIEVSLINLKEALRICTLKEEILAGRKFHDSVRNFREFRS